MSELLLLGASHKTAPLAVRERLALPQRRAQETTRELLSDPSVQEVVALFTCNRTELYVVATNAVEAESAVLAMFARQAGIRPTELVDAMYSLRNCEAARHLYRVVSGLESMVLGETEVQGQVKRAYEQALETRTTGPLTNKLFRAALATGKHVRSRTQISHGRGSVASVAVDLARETLGSLAHRRVVIVGAGETAELTAEALHAEGVSTLFVANRRRERARALAQRFGGGTLAFDDLPTELAAADIVVASTASPHTILGAEELATVIEARGGRPLLLVDLAVPRDIDPACAALPGVELHDVDDLQAHVARTRSVRHAEATRAEAIVEEEIQAFAGWLGTLEVLPTVTALRARGDAIVAQVLADNAGRWESVSARDEERIEALAHAVAKRLLHEPTLRLKQTGADRRHTRLQLLRELFGLEEPAGAPPEAAAPEVPQVGSAESRRTALREAPLVGSADSRTTTLREARSLRAR